VSLRASLRAADRTTQEATAFIHELTFEDLPSPIVKQVQRCLLDLIGVAAGGRRTAASDIACRFAVGQLNSNQKSARILFDHRTASAAGAAYAGATMIDSLDAHDGHPLTKGHTGVALLPALLAVLDAEKKYQLDGRELLVALAVGYEVAIRAGIALHASAADYHTSGAWNALGCAAIAARLLGLDRARTQEALGIAEYHGPRSSMMRCIDHPTMVKDGSGWGAFAGISAAYLAADGFTGAPAVTVEDASHRPLWSDLGECWRILELYFKPEPICRWAQPATEAARQLRVKHDIDPDSIAVVRIETFEAAVRLGTRMPTTTEQAQYAIGFPVAVMLHQGSIGPADVMDEKLRRREIIALCDKITLVQRAELTSRFPQERVAALSITLRDGRVLRSADTSARGDPTLPLSDNELEAKFGETARLDSTRQKAIARAIEALPDGVRPVCDLLDAVLAPI